jgi:hypothetical protein
MAILVGKVKRNYMTHIASPTVNCMIHFITQSHSSVESQCKVRRNIQKMLCS